MRVDLDEVERDWKEHGSIYEHAPALIAELRAARKLIDSGRTGVTVCKDVACKCEQSELWREYLAATKGDG